MTFKTTSSLTVVFKAFTVTAVRVWPHSQSTFHTASIQTGRGLGTRQVTCLNHLEYVQHSLLLFMVYTSPFIRV